MQLNFSHIKGFVWLLVFVGLVFWTNTAKSQLAVTSGLSATQLANIIAGPGITISNATYVGAPIAVGSFDGTASNLNLASGVIITSGDVNVAVGPNNLGSAGVDNLQPGNSQLNGIAGASTYDAATLEFDFVPQSNNASFRYIFASEEYPEWVNSGYNDAFAFYISGPGITGQQNIAVVPGTTLPVTIDNINSGSYSQYYVNNSGSSIQYDAFTTVLTASAQVQSCETYHLKLTIADGGDGIYDSGVFIEENSLVSDVVHVTASTVTADSTAYEGCTNGVITFELSQPTSTPYPINFTVSGTATNGVDYNQLPNSVTIPAGSDNTTLSVTPIEDYTVESVEYIILSLQTSACGFDTVWVFIDDNNPVSVQAFGDTAICGGGQGGSVPIWAIGSGGSGTYLYSWDNGLGTSDAVTVSPNTTTTYTVTVSDSVCTSSSATDQVTVAAGALPNANAGPDIQYCVGDQVSLAANGGVTYEWYELPANTLIGTTATLTLSPSGTIDYYVKAIDNGCFDYDTVSVIERPVPVVDAGMDTAICSGESITMNATGGASYLWVPSTGLSSDSSASPVASPNSTTSYTVLFTDANGCQNTDNVTVTVNPTPQANAGQDVSICYGTTTQLNASGGDTYVWSPSADLSDPNIANPVSSTLATTVYTVMVTNTAGCDSTDEVEITVVPLPVADFDLPSNACIFGDVDVTFTGVGSQSGTYVWDFDGGLVVSGAGMGPYVINWASTGTKMVTLQVMENGCFSEPDTMMIDIKPTPIADAGQDVAFCSGETEVLGASSTPGNTYQWTPTTGLSDATSSNPDIALVNSTSNTQVIPYTITTTSQFGCKSEDEVNVTVFPIPVAEFGNPEGQCVDGHAFDFNGDGVFGSNATFYWDFGTNASPSTSTVQNPTAIVFSGPSTYPVSFTVTENGCTSPVYDGEVEVYPMPIASFDVLPAEGCQPHIVQFLDLSEANGSSLGHEWDYSIGTSNASAPVATYQFPGTYDVSLTVTSFEGCVDDTTVSDIITVYPLPKAGFIGEPDVVSIFEPTIDFFDQSTGADSCVYYIEGGVVSTSCNWEYTFPDTGWFVVTQVVYTEHGCADTTDFEVYIQPEFTLYVPNAFSPNSDGYNDEFYCYGTGISEFRMNIFDRWGENIYFSTDIKQGWDGFYKLRPATNDVYIYRVWVMDVNYEEHIYTGHVTIVR